MILMMDLAGWLEHTEKIHSFHANLQTFHKQVFQIVMCMQSFIFCTAVCHTTYTKTS